jgi:hypothetical protein
MLAWRRRRLHLSFLFFYVFKLETKTKQTKQNKNKKQSAVYLSQKFAVPFSLKKSKQEYFLFARVSCVCVYRVWCVVFVVHESGGGGGRFFRQSPVEIRVLGKNGYKKNK